MKRSIRRLGRHVESLWAKQGYRRAAFTTAAVRALEETRLHESIDPQEVIDWCLRARSLPRQLSKDNNFGHPPVTLFWSPKDFLIDAYFWMRPKISIHDHSFSGAFAVLRGSSLQCLYNFDRQAQADPRVRLGRLSLGLQERLKPGDIRPIVSGSSFIHEVWHIGAPTVSLVIRTRTDGGSQFRYYRDDLAVATSVARDPVVEKRRTFLEFLHQAGDPTAQARFLELLERCDPYRGILYTLTHLHHARDADRALRSLRLAPRRHRVWLDPLARAFGFERLVKSLDFGRCREEDTRLLLALLLSSPDRRAVFAALKREDPRTAPAAQVTRGLARLAEDGVADLRLPPLALSALRYMLEGMGPREVYSALRRERKVPAGGDVEAKCRVLCAGLRSIPLLGPLFA